MTISALPGANSTSWYQWATDIDAAVRVTPTAADLLPKAPATRTATTYAFVLADANVPLLGNSASAQTFTIPTNAAVAFPIGTRLRVIQYGAGVVTLSTSSGASVTLNGTLVTPARFAALDALKVGTDEWVATSSTYITNVTNNTTTTGGAGASAPNTFLVDAYKQSGDPDDTLSFTRCAAAMVAAGAGVLLMSAKTYTVTALPTFTVPAGVDSMPYGMLGVGSAVTNIVHHGTSEASSLKFWDPSFLPDEAPVGALPIKGFSLDGTGSTGGTCGIIWSDVSYVTFDDVQVANFTTGAGWKFPNAYGWTEGVQFEHCIASYNQWQIRFGVGLGQKFGTISTAIANGATITSIAVSGGVTRSLYSGQRFVITNAAALESESVTVTANVAIGATSIPISSFTASQAYAAGTAGVYVGSYGSFDYWTVSSLYMSAGPNQDGIYSEIPRGIDQKIDRIGATWRVTGNFGTGTTNTGAFMRLLGTEHWTDNVFDITCEMDGGANAAHASMVLASGANVTGWGRFFLYYFSAASANVYQVQIAGTVGLAGLYGDGHNSFQSGTFNRYTAYGVGATYATPTAGTAYLNATSTDLLVTVPITFTATGGTAGYNVDTYSGLASGPVMAKGNAGFIIPLTFIHYAGMYARVDLASATIGAPTVRII